MKKPQKPIRQRFPKHERKYEWLPMLLDAYHANNVGAYNELKSEIGRRKQKIACQKGCYYCCLKPVVPISEIEIVGISWFASEMITDHLTREKLKNQLINHKENLQCPFLIVGDCSIYPARPIACREYHMFGEPCKKDEMPEQTRPSDVWSPSREVARKTALKILPFFGFRKKTDIIKAYEGGFIHNNSRAMHLIDWSVVAQTMSLYDPLSILNT